MHETPPRPKAIAKAAAREIGIQFAVLPLFGFVAALAALVATLR
jgi:uncharacterized protein (DUF2062 family)